MKKTGIFALVSGELLGSVGGGYLLGKWLDQKFHSAPGFTAGIAMCGLGYSVWRVNQISKSWFDGKNDSK